MEVVSREAMVTEKTVSRNGAGMTALTQHQGKKIFGAEGPNMERIVDSGDLTNIYSMYKSY